MYVTILKCARGCKFLTENQSEHDILVMIHQRKMQACDLLKKSIFTFVGEGQTYTTEYKTGFGALSLGATVSAKSARIMFVQ